MSERDTITVWPGKGGWEAIDELDELAEESDASRNELIMDAIELFLQVGDVLEGHPVWDEAGRRDRRIMLSDALSSYRREKLDE